MRRQSILGGGLRAAAVWLGIALLVGGCGQKGPLTLPPPADAKSSPDNQRPAPR